MRTRNTILVFLQDKEVRRVFVELLTERGWSVLYAESSDGTHELFVRRKGEIAAVVVDDAATEVIEYRTRRLSREGVAFIEQRQTDLFVFNIPFVLLMFRGDMAIQEWVEQMNGECFRLSGRKSIAWSVAMPGRMAKVAVLLDVLERGHQPPRLSDVTIETNEM